MNAYSEDLREKIVEALRRGMGKSQAARTFSVSLSSVKRYAKRAEEGRSLAPKKRPGSKPKIDERARKLLEEDLKERPFVTLQERCDYLQAVAGLEVSRSVVCRTIKGMETAGERDEWLRAAWRVTVAAVLEPEQLVFVDECGFHTSLALLYGYAP